jgi:Dolichyl-phosphate-mannose-protein mannosyltransferase
MPPNAEPASPLARKPLLLITFAIFTLLYFAGTVGNALAKPLWYDELFTVYLSRLPHLSDLWAALSQGADQQPPLIFLVSRLTAYLPFNELITYRLPAMLSFWVMCLCLYRFVARRVSVPYALIAMLLPILTTTYTYAYEARPYGLLLGLCGLALICWQSLVEGRFRWLAWLGFTLSLILAIASHFYALILIVPFAVAEAVYFLLRRQVRWNVLLALSLAFASELLFIPILRGSLGFAAAYSLHTTLSSIPDVYVWFLDNSIGLFILPALALLIPLLLTLPLEKIRARLPAPFSNPPSTYSISLIDYAVAGVIALIPVLVVVIAVYITHGFSPRYAIYAIAGLAILAAFFLSRLETHQPLLGWIIAGLFIVLMVFKLGGGVMHLFQPPQTTLNDYSLLLKDNTDLPIAVAYGVDYLPLEYQAPQPLAGRLLYLADQPAALHYTGVDSPDRSLPLLGQWAPFQVEAYPSYIQTHKQFLVYELIPGWLIPKLLDDGAQVTVRVRQGSTVLYLITVAP